MTYGMYYYGSCYLALAILLVCLAWVHTRKPFMFGSDLTFPDVANYKDSPIAPLENDAPDAAPPKRYPE